MITKRFLVATMIVVGAAVGLLLVPPATGQDTSPNRVAGRVYDLWVLPSFAPPGSAPFHDCARFEEARICLDQCGDCGGLAEVLGQFGSSWQARVPCQGLELAFFGTSVDGYPGSESAKPVFGATLVGVSEKTTFGASGVENASCTLESRQARANPYSKPKK